MTGKIASHSLQQKMTVTLLAIMAVLVLLSWLILKETVTPAFTDLERSVAHTNLVRARRAIQNDLDNLSAIVGDWAPWDDAYAYARGEYPGFQKSNLDRPTLANLDLDLLLIYDADANLLWGQLIQNGAMTDPAALEIFDREHPAFDKLVGHGHLESRTDGLVQTALGPMLISSQPIITSNNEGPIAGTMIMAQFFDQERLERLRARTEVLLDLIPLGSNSPLAVPLQNDIVSAGDGPIRYVTRHGHVDTYSLLNDLFGEPLMILGASTPRNISALGSGTVNGALLSLTIAGIVVAIVTWWLLRSIIVMPLERLANHITAIRRSGDLSVRLNERRSDEVGALAGEFDRMTKELHDARRLLLEQSFKAGKADTAAEVLHNIRNAMTPLINGIDRVTRSVKLAAGLRVPQATAELGDKDCPPERREKLLAYIDSAFGHVQTSGDEAVEDLQIASRQAHQVEAILADQERFANVSPVIENLDLNEVVEEAALVLSDREDEAGVRLNLQSELASFRVRAHRVGLLQVLGNLILNAYEAIQRNQSVTPSTPATSVKPAPARIDVLASLEQQEEGSMVRVTVRDSGCGFDEDVRSRIFQRGFTSKQRSEFAGLGLHWCANSLAAMGGRILAESMGPGRGAAFHVLLPGVRQAFETRPGGWADMSFFRPCAGEASK